MNVFIYNPSKIISLEKYCASCLVSVGRHRIEPKLLAGPELLSSKVGESVVFECAVTSIPQVSIIWRRGGKYL